MIFVLKYKNENLNTWCFSLSGQKFTNESNNNLNNTNC